MQKHEIELETVTPMFISGSDPKKIELRASSVKGVLRWWWRALNGHLSLNDLKEKEAVIFGSTDRKSSFSLRIEASGIKQAFEKLPSGKKKNASSKGRKFPISIIDYLAYGIAEYDKREKGNIYNRPHIKPTSKFRIFITIFNDAFEKEILNTLSVWIKYGGLGAKSRNGFGCMRSDQIEAGTITRHSRAHYVAFSEDSKLFLFKEWDTWYDALVEAGSAYREARMALEPRHAFDRRPYVATPIIVKTENISINERHAKQFFFHVNKRGNKYQGQILCLPYKYHKTALQAAYESVFADMCIFLDKKALKEVTDAL